MLLYDDGLWYKNPPAAAINITLMPAHSIKPFFSLRENRVTMYKTILLKYTR